MRMSHPWSSGVEDEVDIMPVSREQYNSRNATVDRHYMKRRLVEKRKEEWKKMLKKDGEEVPKSINYRANQKNKVKREVVAATAQRLNDGSHAAIREMRSARLSATHTQAQNAKEPKSQSAREMRLARLKQGSSSTLSSPPEVKHKSLKKAVRVEKPPEQPKDTREQITSSIREMRLAQGKAPVAKSYTSSTPVLRIPKTATTAATPPVKSVRPPKQVPIRTVPKQQVEEVVEEEEEESRGCTFVMDDLAGGCNGLPQAQDVSATLLQKKDDLAGGCNAAAPNISETAGCDFSMMQQQLSSLLGCEEEVPGVDLVSRGSSEDSATMYVKKYGYDF